MDVRHRYEAKKEADKRRAQERERTPYWWLGQHDPVARFSKWLVIWTALLFLGTVGSALILWKTDDTLNRTLAANERPWIEVAAEPASDFAYVKVLGTIDFTAAFDLKNIGKTPALYTWVYAKLTTDAILNTGIPKVAKRVCNVATGGSHYKVGYLIFPGNHLVVKPPIIMTPQESSLFFRGVDPGPRYRLRDAAVVACVAYRDVFSPKEIHKTVIVARLVQNRPGFILGVTPITMDGDHIPQQELGFDKLRSYSGDEAD